MKNFYIGGYSKLYHCAHDGSGNAEILNEYDIINPSFLAFSPDKRILYSVLEIADGGLASFSVESDGSLVLINEVKSNGAAPCHLSVAEDLYVAHYSSGSTVVFEINADGSIGHIKHVFNHADYGKPSRAYPGRQEKCHAHFVQPAAGFLWVCDLGLDAVLCLDFDGHELGHFSAPPGFGPRHLAFHETRNCAYLVGEMDCSVIGIHSSSEDFSISRAVSTLREKDPKCTSAAVRVSPGGGHLLVSNRGGVSDSISVLSLNEAGRIMKLKSVVESGGRCPRDFCFDPSGDWVFVANQDSDSLNTFRFEKGELKPTGQSLAVEKPTCVIF